MNRYETKFIHTLAEGAAAIAELGSERLGLLGDTYHMNIEGAQPADSLAACAPSCGTSTSPTTTDGRPGWGTWTSGSTATP